MLFQRGVAYSQDLRERVFILSEGGKGVAAIARLLHVSVAYVSKALSRLRQTGERSARPQRCHLVPKLADLHAAIGDYVIACPDATLAEIRAWLLAAYGVSASDALMHRTLLRLGLTLKKSRYGRRSRIARMSPLPAPHGGKTSPA